MENQNNDYSSVVDTIANMFEDVLTKEVICTVVESYEGDLNLSVEAIMNITSDTKSSNQSQGEVTSSSQLQVEQIPTTSKVEKKSISNSAVPSTSFASVSQNKGAIPKQTARKTLANKTNFCTEQIRQIITYHNQGARVLILLRGAPGSGKTFLAKQIVDMTIGSTYHAYKKHTFSTDDFFMNKGQYQYDKSRLGEAHAWNQYRVKLELFKGLSPLIVDNTNIELWEMEPYLREGVKNGYYIEVVEPNTQWAKKANQLWKRNVHNVPLPTIKRMLENYQENISGLYLMQAYGLSYPGNMVPPVLRNDPPIKAEVEEPEEKKEEKLQSDLTEEECSAVLQIQESGTSEGLTEATPQPEYIKNNKCEPHQNTEETQGDLQIKSPQNSPEKLTHHEIIKQQQILEYQKRLDELRKVETAWENGESWDVDSKKCDTACSKTTPTLNTKPKPPRKQQSEESVLSAKILDSVNKCDDWSQISMFMPSWNDIPQPSTVANDEMNKDNFVEKKSSSTCIEIGDTDIVNNKHNYKIISATPKDINLFHVSLNKEKIPDKRSLDKSTLTYEHTISKAYRCKNEEHHFASFRKMFKNVLRSDLRDIFDKCQGDVNWAVDIVLDSMNNKLLGTVDTEELSDKEEEIVEPCECLAAYNIIPDGVSTTSQSTANTDIQDNTNDNKPQVPKKSKKDAVVSESSMQLKHQIEKNFNIADNHYSPYCLRLRKMRHGEPVKAEDSSDPQSNIDSQDTASGSNVGSSEATTASIDNSDSEEESNAECIDEPAKVENVNVGMEFITMLDEMFGRKDMIYPNNVTPSMSISVSILNELNASWMESLMYQLENNSKQMQEIIKQDEEFARALALKEEELLIAGKEPAVPDFKEIMDMDLAISLYQKDVEDWRNSEPQNLAAKMTRDKLYNLFPEVPQDVLAELLVAHHNNFKATVESLLISTGRHEIFEQENGVNKFVMEKEIQRQKKILDQEKEALSEDESPLLPKGETATMATVNKFRELAEMHLQRRNLSYQNAQEYIRRGMTQVAGHYSNITAYHKRRYEQSNSLAAAALMQVHAQNNPDATTIDLHYMRVGEAKESLDIFLDYHIRKLQDSQSRGARYVSLFLITGRGLHSHGQPRIKPAVKKRLRERSLAFSERNPGLLTARVCAEDKLSYQIPSA